MVVPILVGGMANQMAQMMCAIAYARKHNMPYAIPTTTSNPKWRHYKFGNVHYEDIDTSGFYHYKSPDIFYEQRPYNVSYQEIPYHENIILEGHFQSWKYWIDYVDEIRDIFGMPILFTDEGRSVHNHIALHYRRGDYMTMLDKLPPVKEEYIFNGITHFMNSGFEKFIGFSDEIEYLKGMIKGFDLPSNILIEFSERHTDEFDLALMSSCAGIVMANSSFSLLSYYLNRNPNKQAVAPRIWLGKGFGDVCVDDLYPPGSLVI